MKIGVIGNGFVGKATSIFECKDIELLTYDINHTLCNPIGLTLQDMIDCDIIFVSVPTPMKETGECHLNIVKDVIKNLNDIHFKNYIVLRSTVPVGTCDALGVYFMPEFLTEKNFIDDFKNAKQWIIGLPNEDAKFKHKMNELIKLAKNNDRIKNDTIIFMTNKEAEMVKIFKNCFLATKVSFCNEIAQFCNKKDINYENVRMITCQDDRILHSHSMVPGPDSKKGFGGTCFPKDMNSLNYEMKKENIESFIIKSAIERNDKIDRKKKDWKNNKGRSVI
jgi:nucleotide sugar dehydrogenase